MAMDKNALGAALADVVVSASSTPPSGAQLTNIKAFWTDMAGAIIAHIQSNAAVQPGIPVSTTGSSSAQAGATTGPGVIQ